MVKMIFRPQANQKIIFTAEHSVAARRRQGELSERL